MVNLDIGQAQSRVHPGARRAIGATVWKGNFLIHGGFGLHGRVTPDAVASDLWQWRAGWRNLATDGPPPARYPSLCSTEDGVYRFGGCGVSKAGATTFLDSLWLWNDAWSAVKVEGTRPEGRYMSALAACSDALLMFGGYSLSSAGSKTFYGDLWRFENRKWARLHGTETGPGRRYGFGWVQTGDKLYIFGGFDGTVDRNDFWSLDLPGLRWSRLEEGPPARYCPALGVVGDTVVLFGGRSKTDPKLNLADTWLYDGRWRRFDGDGPGYHAKPAYASNGGALWVYGGEGPRGHVSDLWCFQPAGWALLESSRPEVTPSLW